MSEASPSASPPPMIVLAASGEAGTLQTIERAITAQGDHLVVVMDLAEAIATTASEKPDVAFVDVMLDGGAGLALVHHLTAVAPGIAVYAMAPQANVEMLSQAVALGAAGFVPLPLSGDALLGAVGAVREKRAAAEAKAKLEADLSAARRRAERMDRLVRIAHGAGLAEVARAILEALVEAAEAPSGALYAAFDASRGEAVRLAVSGAADELPATCSREELARVAKDRGAWLVPLAVAERLLAYAVLEGAAPGRDEDVNAMVGLAATVLAFVDAGEARHGEPREPRGRVYAMSYLEDIGGREIDKARRHNRRLAVATVVLAPDVTPKMRGELEEIIVSVIRDTDVLARGDDASFTLLLPETGALGAHACRRRLLLRAEGDKRVRAATSDRRGPASARAPSTARPLPMAMGIAAYPHDGTALDRLIRTSRRRAEEATRSAVHTLGLAGLPLGDLLDTLIGRPLFGAGNGAPHPLDLGVAPLMSLVATACREARRGGAAHVLVTMQPGMGLVSAARQALSPDPGDVAVQVADVRALPRCEDVEAIVVAAEHGTWVCCGRSGEERFRGVHAADPLLADLVAQRLAQASGIRFP